MQFQSQLRILNDVGFRSLLTIDYFFTFVNNQGKSIRELYPPTVENGETDLTDYHQATRHFRILSGGTNRAHESGMQLFTTIPVKRTNQVKGRSREQLVIVLTEAGQELIDKLKTADDLPILNYTQGNI